MDSPTPIKDYVRKDYHWYVDFNRGRPFIVTGDLDYVVQQYPFATVRQATQEDVDRMERKSKENELLGKRIKKARR
jgi:hypothetical protein